MTNARVTAREISSLSSTDDQAAVCRYSRVNRSKVAIDIPAPRRTEMVCHSGLSGHKN